MLGTVALLAAGLFANYRIASIDVDHPHASLERVVYHVQVGQSPLDRFDITHVHKKGGHAQGSFILLSPFLLPGAFYEISETGEYQQSAAGRLAQSNVDVWLVDQRHTGLESGACESGAADCSVMAHWDFDTYSRDALFATALVEREQPDRRPVIGGFSAGANAALATINRAPHAFSGVFLYEGTFFTEDPAIIAHNDGICDALEARVATGDVFDASAALPGLVLRLSAADPDGIFPIAAFPPGTTNQQATLFVYGTPPPAGALSPTPNFVRCSADLVNRRFIYTNQDRLELAGPLFDNYASVPALRDLACGLAGRDDSHFDSLDRFRGHVLIFVEGTGFGPAMFDTASLFENAASVRIDHNPELGEADPYFHQRWPKVFYQPLRDWLRRAL